MLSVALCGASAIYAADVTNPFYVPAEGKFLSDTTVTYQNFEHGRAEAALATENLSYGVGKGASVGVTVADSWEFDFGNSGSKKYDNPAVGVNVKYNILDDAAKLQVEGGYNQGFLRAPFENNYTQSFAFAGVHHAKEIFGTVKAGYDLGDGFLPYASITADQIVGEYHNFSKKPVYTTRFALNKTFNEHFTGDVGASYVWNKNKFGGKHERSWVADASLNYLFCENMSVGLKGEYVLDHGPKDPDDWMHYHAYTIGANLKVAF